MRVTLLGTGSADGWPNPFCDCGSCAAERAAGRARRPSAALVDSVVLVDCGPTTPHLPAGSDVTLSAVAHVLLTHGHPDHLQPAFLLSRRWSGPTSTLHVWGPARAIDLCRDWIGPGSAVELHVLAPGDHVRLQTDRGPYEITALPARHAHGGGDVMAEEALLYCVGAPDGARLLYATDTGPFDPGATGLPVDPFDIVLVDETFGDRVDHGTGHLDLATLPGLLAALRTHGCVTDRTRVVATHLSHHNPPTDDLRPRLAAIHVELGADLDVIESGTPRGRRTLVLGGARSGKSRYAEHALAGRSDVTYVATGGQRPGDAEWAERVAAHRARRPAAWTTVESHDVTAALGAASAGSAVLVDCLALWLTAELDGADAWRRLDDGDRAGVAADVRTRICALVAAVRDCPADVVLVSNEVGMGVVPATASGRLFRDLLGVLNAEVAEACDETLLIVAGRPMARSSRG